jgi:hypothetical protein
MVMHATIEGDRRVMQLFSEMADRADGIPADVWAKVGDEIAEHMAEQFATEGAHLTGKAWAPLSPPYLRWKVRHGLHPERLRATDALVSSLISRPMAVEEYSPLEAKFGTDDPKARFHQGGTKFMPQRKIIEVDSPGGEELADDAWSVVARYIFENRL